ncbi:type I-C CRISPR-associated protein Cas8c/Csd1 [Limnohabitans sp.]|uniref:type I-C CRISPR-associated protein Cas8c/Csd1 n=1 Tax=Limnohabitans sp. TaxID=1907725 RepID=UPI00286EF73E|nr:type I-C CRISPR-associated protein Cas8c/Csd1 [Limnohabitans sp.]
MILSSLDALYYKLLENPAPVSGQARVPPFGFTDENISYCLVLSKTGDLVDIQDVRDSSEKKPKARRLSVPQSFKRPGTTPKPFYLWDKTSYLLGIEGNKDKKSAKENPWVFAAKTHAAFQQAHLDWLENQNDVGLQAVRNFLLNWKPERFSQTPFSLEHVDANVIFKLDSEAGYIHERPAAKKLWLSLIEPAGDDEKTIRSVSTCLVTGQQAPLSRLHPAIKGVYGGQSAGGSIVSFNAEAYESYGKSQGDNAPVSEQAAFAYTTALNYLLRRENGHCLSIGDTSTVFWAQAKDAQQEQEAVSLFASIVNPPTDEGQSNKVKHTLEKIAKGRPFEEVAPEVDPSTRFFVLGLAPNAARLSIRYWMDSTLGELGQHLSAHWQDMQIMPLPWSPEQPPSVWRCLIETAVLRKTENISPQLAGEWLRSILTEQRYPRQVFTQLVQRLRSDGDVNGLRAALIKAVLHRDHRKGFTKEAIPMSLELENAPLAYRLGCLFAVLEQAQRGALGDVNSSIVDRYYGTASSVPYSVFPRLIAGCQNHLSKVRKDKPGFAVNLDKQLGGVIASLPHSLPKQLTIEQQGQFAVGYYQQKQSFFTKKDSPPSASTTPSN